MSSDPLVPAATLESWSCWLSANVLYVEIVLVHLSILCHSPDRERTIEKEDPVPSDRRAWKEVRIETL